MAAFREHISFSFLLGLGYGAGASFLLNFSPAEAALAGFLTGVGGMLPDLDSPNARPGQEIFSITAATAPLVLVGHILKATGLPSDTETVILCMLAVYFSVRYGLSWFVEKVSVHRGMFHSLPAMAIAAEVTYMAYPNPHETVKLLMGCGVAVGFLSHLVLDEVYAVRWSGPVPQLKKSFGTALKFAGKSFGPTAVTYVLLIAITFLICEDAGIIGPPRDPESVPMAGSQQDAESGTSPAVPPPQSIQEAVLPDEELPDAPLFR